MTRACLLENTLYAAEHLRLIENDANKKAAARRRSVYIRLFG